MHKLVCQRYSMAPGQFNNLDEAEQAETTWEGIHIADREENEYNILLYKIDNLYVEAFYHREYNVIRKFNAFDKHELLDIYLKKIDLKYLME